MSRSRLGSASAVAGSLLILSGAIALASIPDSSGIHGCFMTANGQLRVIDPATDSCRPSETAITWNQTGPQGLPGPAGPVGPQGPQGPAGPAGAVHVQVVTARTAFDTSTYKTVTALCPAGTNVVSGGAGVFWSAGEDATLHAHVISSFIFPSGTNGWYSEAAAPTASTAAWYLQAQAICTATSINIQLVTARTPLDTTTYKTVTALCPAGTIVIAGGAGVFWSRGEADTLHPHLISSFIFPAGTNGWYGEGAAPSTATAAWYLQTQALCMS